ncbi:hypothetical protein, partial [Photobacterium halotolerans]|uniref:hypothetical protein n=1 Tax=Photobacterium halotolerans TaxID=265726 RepID=UPI001F32472E
YQLVTQFTDKSFMTVSLSSAHTDCMVKLLKNVDSTLCLVGQGCVFYPAFSLSQALFLKTFSNTFLTKHSPRITSGFKPLAPFAR